MPYEFEEVGPILFDDADNKLKISRTSLSVLADIPASTVSKAANGQRPLTYQEYRALRQLVDDLFEIRRRLNGAPLDFGDIRGIRKLVEDLRTERQNPPTPLSQAEAGLLHKFATGDDIDALAIEVRMTREQLLETISELVSRSGRLAAAAK